MIKATIIFGSDIVRHWEQTGDIPDPETFSDTGCLVVHKEFPSQEAYKAYTDALEDYDGFNDYRVVDHEESRDKNLDFRIKEMLREGPMVALYFLAGIIALQKQTDDQLREMFESIISPDQVRASARVIHNRLNGLPDDHQPE